MDLLEVSELEMLMPYTTLRALDDGLRSSNDQSSFARLQNTRSLTQISLLAVQYWTYAS